MPQRISDYQLNSDYHQVTESKTLGLIIDQLLNWKSNTENKCKKISSGISALRHLKEFVDKKTLLSVYNAIIQQCFNYCCEVWSGFGETQSTRLQNLHNRAARIMANISNEISQETALSAYRMGTTKTTKKKRLKPKLCLKYLTTWGQNV